MGFVVCRNWFFAGFIRVWHFFVPFVLIIHSLIKLINKLALSRDWALNFLLLLDIFSYFYVLKFIFSRKSNMSSICFLKIRLKNMDFFLIADDFLTDMKKCKSYVLWNCEMKYSKPKKKNSYELLLLWFFFEETILFILLKY